jgi:hypothetical protein
MLLEGFFGWLIELSSIHTYDCLGAGLDVGATASTNAGRDNFAPSLSASQFL